MDWLYLLLAVIVGGFLSFQTGINAELAAWVGHPIRAALISFAVGACGLLLVSLALPLSWPAPAKLLSAPRWVWGGGLLGASYVAATVLLAPRLGATVLFSLVVVGQMLASLVLDYFGLLRFPHHPLNVWRVLGVALLVAGVALIRGS